MKDEASELSNPNICLKLDLAFLKTQPCKLPNPHLPKRCPYYHDFAKDRRRPPQNYSADMCVYALHDQSCPYADNCTKSHNRVEEFYHPTKYKTRFCSFYPGRLEACEYGDFCCFAHSEADICIDLLHLIERDADFYMFHYKTAWCPFNEMNHDREKCVYAHNWQDYRRKPHTHSYRKDQCPNWSASKIINVYLDGCPNGMKCSCSHGWKEQEFHPLYYKMSSCRYGEACAKPHCPFYHSEKDLHALSDRRFPLNSFFSIVPKNRIIGFSSQDYPDQHSLPNQNSEAKKAAQPNNPPVYMGMEGYTGYISPYMSPHISPQVSPHISPQISPKGSPHMSPTNMGMYYGAAIPQAPYMNVDTYYYQQPSGINYSPSQFTKEPLKKHTQIRTKAAPFIPKQADQRTVKAATKSAEKELPGTELKIVDDDSLMQFLTQNRLAHLASKLSKYGITESFLLKMEDSELSQLGLATEDKKKLVEALEKTKNAGQRAMANLIDFECLSIMGGS
eukprot:TRINITY_DN8455_c0_g1_i12.p1 TRINITY_DN8455_c0_g1~~TRINITY_DN8455_c0_g1_i12.p1  ORF type:complete len:505 (+),score=93.17 TRINITY_DN8455_c0_g1_i12:196-1710(+)